MLISKTTNSNLILCGLPKCGKTTVGKLLASLLNKSFVDLDHKLEAHYKNQTHTHASCRMIFLDKGEQFFRTLEQEVILSLKGASNSVIALGGGSLNTQANIEVLLSSGTLIYLKTSPDVIWKRLQHPSLPAYLCRKNPKAQFEDLIKYRLPVYEKTAHLHIDTDQLDPNAIAQHLVQKLYYYGK